MLVGVIGLTIFMILLVMGVPIAIALFGVGFAGMVYALGFNAAIGTTRGIVDYYIASYTWAVAPMFIFMGQLGFFSGLLSDVFRTAKEWFGRLPGGLGISVEVASAVFASCSGCSVSSCVVIGRPAIPVMQESGYSDAMATGVVAAGGTIANLIPPSVIICVYGLLVQESIGKLLIAGVIPGIITAAIYILYIIVRSWGIPRVKERASWRSRIYSIRYLWVVVVIILAIIGGIFFGICTPTEGGAVGAFVVFVLSMATRRMNLSTLWQSLRATVITGGFILFLIIGAMFLSRFLVVCGFSAAFNEAIVGMGLPKFGMFMMITLVYFTLGCFVGATAMMVMTLPIFYPLMMAMGFNSLWFGIIVVKYVEMAVITPPVGVNLYAVKSVAPNVSLTTIARGAAQFLSMDILTIVLFYFFPQIITFLPSLM